MPKPVGVVLALPVPDLCHRRSAGRWRSPEGTTRGAKRVGEEGSRCRGLGFVTSNAHSWKSEAPPLKVFISSVTHLLKDERNALPDFLRVVDHEPLRFEDSRRRTESSREACLAGVDAADVYVLLLGPRYGIR